MKLGPTILFNRKVYISRYSFTLRMVANLAMVIDGLIGLLTLDRLRGEFHMEITMRPLVRASHRVTKRR